MAASQQDVDSWWTWATGVLNGIGAPTTPNNFNTLWRWTSGEKPAGQPVQWLNPLNTTQKEPGSSDNPAGANCPNCVQVYPNIQTGIKATVDTLTNGRYPTLVYALKQNANSANWVDLFGVSVTQELATWGTGSRWLTSTAAPPAGSVLIDPGNGSLINPGDAANNALNQALGGVGTAISKAETDFVTKALYGLEVVGGVVLMLAGLVVLALIVAGRPLGAALSPVERAKTNVKRAQRLVPRRKGQKAAKGSVEPSATKPEPKPAPGLTRIGGRYFREGSVGAANARLRQRRESRVRSTIRAAGRPGADVRARQRAARVLSQRREA